LLTGDVHRACEATDEAFARVLKRRDACQYEHVTADLPGRVNPFTVSLTNPRQPPAFGTSSSVGCPSSVEAEDEATEAVPTFEERLHRESRIWLRPFIDALTGAGQRVLDVGCGQHYADSVLLAESGLIAFACDRSLPNPPRSAVRAFVTDISKPLPVRTAAVDAVVASLSLHYFPWATTIAIYREIHRVLRPGGLLLFRVNAEDDVEYGAGIGEEIEPGYFLTKGEFGSPRKRFFTEAAVRAGLEGLFAVHRLTHGIIDRYAAPKRVWVCLAVKAVDGA
jgi:SAM-dependent methyltransferase